MHGSWSYWAAPDCIELCQVVTDCVGVGLINPALMQ